MEVCAPAALAGAAKRGVMNTDWIIWGVAGVAVAGVVLRPWRLPEAVWAVAGAVILVASGLLPVAVAWRGVARGTDVYLFLTGMMVLAELAREEGLFDWVAAQAASSARGSARRLFTLVYLAGTIVTVVLSNDATAVVLTPAVAAVAQKAGARDPLPYLLICAFVANAASFVLPISNPANLVVYGAHMPGLLAWVERYGVASVLSIAATFWVLRRSQRKALRQAIEESVAIPVLSGGARVALAGIGGTAVVLLVASALEWPLGLPTFVAGLVTAAAVLLWTRTAPWVVVRGVSWGVLPLVAGLFVLVQALEATGVLRMLSRALEAAAQAWPAAAAWGAGALVAVGCNLVNNLPAGLIAGGAVQAAHVPQAVTGAVLIGVDLGPNLSVTGSLATILWLTALRRDGLHVDAWTFLKLGVLVMPPALLLALAGLFLTG
jgi:arsenical pump membrane protein